MENVRESDSEGYHHGMELALYLRTGITFTLRKSGRKSLVGCANQHAGGLFLNKLKCFEVIDKLASELAMYGIHF